jgi:hypothetical protein
MVWCGIIPTCNKYKPYYASGSHANAEVVMSAEHHVTLPYTKLFGYQKIQEVYFEHVNITCWLECTK